MCRNVEELVETSKDQNASCTMLTVTGKETISSSLQIREVLARERMKIFMLFMPFSTTVRSHIYVEEKCNSSF